MAFRKFFLMLQQIIWTQWKLVSGHLHPPSQSLNRPPIGAEPLVKEQPPSAAGASLMMLWCHMSNLITCWVDWHFCWWLLAAALQVVDNQLQRKKYPTPKRKIGKTLYSSLIVLFILIMWHTTLLITQEGVTIFVSICYCLYNAAPAANMCACVCLCCLFACVVSLHQRTMFDYWINNCCVFYVHLWFFFAKS